ncbi:GNAT family N-acetyltransferase; N-acetyltransferase [Marinobacter sp. HN1S83]|uniref:GNAT family N-acetyltransferase n=1 Tax=Marinobacter sp. HN1S83 TaxID=3382301 RepID=UPI00387B9B0F
MSSVKLRALQQKDRAAVVSMLGDSRVMRFLGPRRPLTEDEANSWFRNALDNPSRFVIAEADTDEFIGFCGIKEINDVLDFGYFIRSEFWGKGIAAKACQLAVEKLATEVDLEAAQVFIAEDNVASQKVTEKLGWQVKQVGYKDGEHGRYYRITL